ncbi:hypothetical protein [Paraburkholderia saeva]|uniref:Uncharacterized protein n=1 Tax=Paraburkholderia saeva TaxID=2777537 RepID=A0A9N8X3M8_9BURK|nr:hypothetical protein [Paraburkholderia saeva]CAG4903351.1 hypothetical protein LMG31841_03222 [Paraburkholderia saeva]
MATRKKPASATPGKQANMTVEQQESESKGKAFARLAGSPTFRASITERQIVGTTMGGAELHLLDVNSALTERFLKVTEDGDMATPEAMLLAQAHTCEAIFHEFARRSLRSDTMPRLEAYMRMALKAQQQSASTLRVLGELKNPRVATFVKQANITSGNQQVNNGPVMQGNATSTHAHARTEEKPVATNELLTDDREAQHAATLDTGTTGRTVRENPALAAVGEVHRATE